MDEKEKDLQEFSLEDIMKEFSEGPRSGPEDVKEFLRETPSQVQEVPGDTIVIPVAPKKEQVTGDTVALDRVALERTIRESLAQTQRFEPVGQAATEEPQAEPAKPNQEQAPEPFTGDWEPEYEQPMGNYVPPQPIVFHPRSRLRELKKKLVAGPEKRFYELSEQGVGKLQVAMILCFVVVILSTAATVLYELDMVPADRMKLMVFGQFFAMLVAALLGAYQLMEGLGDIFRLRFSLNSLLVFTLGVCVADGIFCLQELRVPCCAAFSLQVLGSLWGAYHKRTTEMAQMDTMRKAVRLDSLVACPDHYEGRTGILRGEGQVEDFMDHYNQPSNPERVVTGYALVALAAGIGAAVMGTMVHGLSAGLQAAGMTLLAAAPASFFVTISRPTAILQKRLHGLGTVFCGWQGVKVLARKSAFPLTHEDLFPVGTTKMNGVKYYGSRNPDEVVAYTAAVITANGGGLAPLFEQLLDSRNGRHYEPEALRAYGEGGVGGVVNGEPVLVGLLSFMKDMGVEIPEGTRVNQAVYAAIDGELCGLFAITYETDPAVAAGMRTLSSYGHLRNVLVTEDFMQTEGFVRSKFGVRTKRFAFPDQETRRELRVAAPEEGTPALALMTKPGLAPMAYAVTGARVLRTACRLGVAIHLLAGVLGIAMMLVLTWFGSLHLMTPANMFLYELVWLVPALLVTEWTRSV